MRGPGRLGHLQRPLQPQLELTAVREAGKRVVGSVVGELLRQLVRGRDVGQRALVEQHPALGVTHRAGVLQHDDLGTVLALEQQLGVTHLAAFGHDPYPVVAVLGVEIDVLRDVQAQQLVLRVVAQHPHQRRVRCHELAVRRSLEDSRRDVLEELPVALLRGLQCQQRVRALGGIAQHLVDKVRRDLVLAQEVERAALQHVVADVFVLLADQGDDRDVGGLGLDSQERSGALAVGQVEVQQNRVEPPLLEPREAVGQARNDFQLVRPPVHGHERRPDLRLFARCRTDQQNGCSRHWSEYR